MFISYFFISYFLCLSSYTSAIINRDENVTKPPLKQEPIQWPQTNRQNNNLETLNEPPLENTPVPVPKDQVRSDFGSTVSYCPSREVTGQFPYKPDCRKFLNCWKGRGYVQNCSPGTLFNPETRECDHASRVNCQQGNSLSNGQSRTNYRSTADRNNLNSGYTPIAPNYNSSSVMPWTYYQTELNNNPTVDKRRNDDRNVYPVSTQNFVNGQIAVPNNIRQIQSESTRKPLFIPASTQQIPNNRQEYSADGNVPGLYLKYSYDYSNEQRYNSRSENNNNNNNYNLQPVRNPMILQYQPQSNTQNVPPYIRNNISPNRTVPNYPVNEPSQRFNTGYQGDSYNRINGQSDSTYYNPVTSTQYYTPYEGGNNNRNFYPDTNSNYYQQTTPATNGNGNTEYPAPERVPGRENWNAGYGGYGGYAGTVPKVVPGSAAVKCPNDFSGITEHPLHCAKYLSCANGRTFIMDCAPGTHFNPTLSVCDYPNNVQCNKNGGQASEVEGRGNFPQLVSNSELGPSSTPATYTVTGVDNVRRDSTVPNRNPSDFSYSNGEFGPRRDDNIYPIDSNTGDSSPFPPPPPPPPLEPLDYDSQQQFTNSHQYGTIPRFPNPQSSTRSPSVSQPYPSYNPYNPYQTDQQSTSKSFSTVSAPQTSQDVSVEYTTFTPFSTPVSRQYPRYNDSPRSQVKLSDQNLPATTYRPNKPVTAKSINTSQPQPTPGIREEPLNSHSYYNPNTIDVDSSGKIKPPKESIPKGIEKDMPHVKRQLVRLRGGSTNTEGFLQMQIAPHTWGVVCDEPGQWKFHEADVVCKQLGYERGVERTWQGHPSLVSVNSDIIKFVAASSVSCTGNETSILHCTTKQGTCETETNSIWVRCYGNPTSQCNPDEVIFNDTCYKLVIPNEESTQDTEIGYSKEEAVKHCTSMGGRLIDILSQKENNFISEWLVKESGVPTIMTSGVGISVFGNPVWIWEGTQYTLVHQNWWPGWEGKPAMTPMVESKRAMCVLLERHYPCKEIITSNASSLCNADYFYWNIVDCGSTAHKHPYICKRPSNKIGCVSGNGSNYTGTANVTSSKSSCMPWDSPLVLEALRYKVSEKMRISMLSKHNHCRNPDGTDLHPWCYVEYSNDIKKQYCDIPSCDKSIRIYSLPTIKGDCQVNSSNCKHLSECGATHACHIPVGCTVSEIKAKCDEQQLENFFILPGRYLKKIDKLKFEKHTNISNFDCARKCSQSSICQSFSYTEKEKICLLNDRTESSKGSELESDSTWTYYKSKNTTEKCNNNMFLCNNGFCINRSSVCNGRNDCGDRSDEKQNCSKQLIGYDIRLIDSDSPLEGHLQVKFSGEWGYVCDDQFDIRDADVACRELGYIGAEEVKLHSHFSTSPESGTGQQVRFLLDELQCLGNESSLNECDFPEWGVHDCTENEIAGVVCRATGREGCDSQSWQCENTIGCIPITFLCDTVVDCQDGSDESPTQCTEPVELRLVGDNRRSGAIVEGRLEVKRHGIWGTVCDDDFGDNEAAVVCKSLGYNGPAQAIKEAAFGAGDGQIWLDQVHCSGNESSLIECLHAKWGEHNCKHEEDVSVICSLNPSTRTENTSATVKPVTLPDLRYILPEQCGISYAAQNELSSQTQGRVVNGHTTTKGAYPWQASVRLRTGGKSSHWCGAVIITKHHVLTAAHCLQGHSNDFYIIRVGDHNTELKEEGEEEYNIAEIYQHENYNKDYKLNNDIAVVKLKGDGISFGKYLQPVCLPNHETPYNSGLNCTTSGWGSDGTPGDYARILRSASIPILSKDICTAKYVYGNSSISDGMYCAGYLDGGTDSCEGDSGGPMVCHNSDNSYTLYGLTSWGHGCGRANKPGVYTNISYYVNWIHDILRLSADDLVLSH